MKKFKLLALALMTSLMLMGAGYAAWTDTVVVNNTVETGELNVKFDQGTFSGFMYPDACADQYVKASAKVDDKDDHTMKVDLNGLYPGSWAAFRIKGINSGTIPAKIDSIDVKFNGDTDLLQYLSYETYITIDPNGDNNNLTTFKLNGDLANIKDDFNKKLKSIENIQLEPNNKGCFYLGVPKNGFANNNNNNQDNYIVIRFDKDAPNALQNKTLSFDLTINFKQFNQ